MFHIGFMQYYGMWILNLKLMIIRVKMWAHHTQELFPLIIPMNRSLEFLVTFPASSCKVLPAPLPLCMKALLSHPPVPAPWKECPRRYTESKWHCCLWVFCLCLKVEVNPQGQLLLLLALSRRSSKPQGSPTLTCSVPRLDNTDPPKRVSVTCTECDLVLHWWCPGKDDPEDSCWWIGPGCRQMAE